MQTDYLTRKVQPLQHRRQKKPLSEEVASMYKVLTVTICVLGVSAIVSYLYINSLSPAKGYQLKQLQVDYENLMSESRDLERAIINAQSFNNIEETDEIGEMEIVNSDEFTYVDEDNKVAKNNE